MNDFAIDMFRALWAAAEKAGPFATLFMLFAYYVARQDLKYERDERSKLQTERDALLERVMTAINNAAVSVSAATQAVDAMRISFSSFIEATVQRTRR